MLDVSAKRARVQDSLTFTSGPLDACVASTRDDAERAAAGIWRREPSAWSDDPAVQATILKRLGWMTSPAVMADAVDRLVAFADSVKHDGFTDIVLLGMGGSSLAPEVLRAVVGTAPEWPRFQMLDSTDPASVLSVATPIQRTLFILASKSGGTIEPNSLAAHFRAQLEKAGVPRWADHFVAITDEGTDLHRRATAERFREVFVNPSDIGGRYSALSFFGLVPAALMGQNIRAMIDWALAMLAASEPGFGTGTDNPAVGLGLAIGAGARAGRDKLTLVVPAALEPFGLWVEQLIAESTGKHGKGVIPIAGEPLARAAAYGTDRLFVRIRMHGEAGEDARDADMRGIEASGAPIVTIDLAEPSALGAEFVRWEIATAVAGALLRINPFDEPNVQQAKDATRALLDQYKASGQLPAPPSDHTLPGGIQLTASGAARKYLTGQGPDAILTLLRQGDYFSLLAYLGPDPELAEDLQAFRRDVRDRAGVATMFGYGPRYLHSTGQLHKGGPNTGVFVIVSAAPHADVPIPGEPYTFGVLEAAQAIGDFQSLDAAARRALYIHLPAPDRGWLRSAIDALLAGQ